MDETKEQRLHRIALEIREWEERVEFAQTNNWPAEGVRWAEYNRDSMKRLKKIVEHEF